jgi:tagaturonate epimerase
LLAKSNQAKCLGVISKNDDVLPLFEGSSISLSIEKDKFELKICPLNQTSCNSFRKILPHFSARTFGLRKSAGFGDRLGLATPGHLQSAPKTSIAPIIA